MFVGEKTCLEQKTATKGTLLLSIESDSAVAKPTHPSMVESKHTPTLSLTTLKSLSPTPVDQALNALDRTDKLLFPESTSSRLKLSIVVLLSRPQQVQLIPQADYASISCSVSERMPETMMAYLEKRIHHLKDEMLMVETALEKMHQEHTFF
ncbi:hypothetical protein Acr_08g0011220 [Actinidia rufa]|uniref:Uncharacterized protein n=1 Tax=Actinidia rufa TaxID=165716 RepID=A0A7J0F2U6_9ERIC|nr:hypothetical protein Acr_08g0011220 [Actinidia rufa]